MSNYKVEHIPCGPYANESEKKACEGLRAKLQRLSGKATWIFLTNIPFSFSPNCCSDEIDLIVLGPPGIAVIEIKHWDRLYLKKSPEIVEKESEKLNSKVKKLAARLRSRFDIGFLTGRILLTKESSSLKDKSGQVNFRGLSLYSLSDWEDLLSVYGNAQLDGRQVIDICKFIEPRTRINLTGDIRAFGDLVNLERMSPQNDRFHRIYRGIHVSRRERVILHLYDLSASQNKKALEIAKREYETLQKFQKSRYLPLLLDAFRDASEYPGELYYYSIVEHLVPSLRDLASDKSWTYEQRLEAGAKIAKALQELHSPSDIGESGLVHRNLNYDNIKYRLDKSDPIFTELQWARLQSYESISDALYDFKDREPFFAPEVIKSGLGVADARSDIYSLCVSLSFIFQDLEQDSEKVFKLLNQGLALDPQDRISLEQLSNGFENLLPRPTTQEELDQEDLAPDYWHDEFVCKFKGSEYRVLERLGAGGIGQTFRVMQINSATNAEYGAFVAKTVNSQKDGMECLEAYRLVRTYSVHTHLAVVHEVATDWKPNKICAIMRWVDGMPLSDLSGVIELHAEDLQENSVEDLALRWVTQMCDALGALHSVNLVHGDVTPKNIIVTGDVVTLTDYDSVTKIGNVPRIRSGQYCSPSVQQGAQIVPADDIYSLASSLFHVIYERDPFLHGVEFRKDMGLSWNHVDKVKWPRLKAFLDKATHASPDQRFLSTDEALTLIASLTSNSSPATQPPHHETKHPKTPNMVPRLLDILKSYPGSLKGNDETRGLDTNFSEETYVETGLDQVILKEIQDGTVSLVILFGNAGDGKTAFLQHLAQKLGLEKKYSSDRIWELTLPNGVIIKANMDGSAAFQGKPAVELLDEFFDPFQKLEFPDNLVGVLAINSGPLLEWIEKTSAGQTQLTVHLEEILVEETNELHPRLRFIDLNNRSLVGGFEGNSKEFSTQFPEKLIEALLGNQEADHWMPCTTCTAATRCSAWESVLLLRNQEKASLVKQRFFEALQAVHHKGEIHITVREIRAVISYIFFGLYECGDLHRETSIDPGHYFDRAFDPLSKYRQGDLLRELTKSDPALESHPKVDRYLIDKNKYDSSPPSYPNLSLISARRRAYFEWLPDWMERISYDNQFGLCSGRHLQRFREVHVMTSNEKAELCKDLCLGISRLEDLPPNAFQDSSITPLKITPRTPTETCFWVTKLAKRFSLAPKSQIKTQGLETLHTHLILTYHYDDTDLEELLIGADLFHILLELKDGFQLADAASEDIFANLSIFTQRLAQENSREIYAWNPMDEDSIFRIWVDASARVQQIRMDQIHKEGM